MPRKKKEKEIELLDEELEDLGLLEVPDPGTFVVQNTGRRAIHTGLKAPDNKVEGGQIKTLPEACAQMLIDANVGIELVSK